jgi:hypothetical protein
MSELDKYEQLLSGLSTGKIEGETLPPFADQFRGRTREVIMNDADMIEVGPDDETQTIGTSSLGGCLAIVAVVEDLSGKRRCGLGHYDPMSLCLELEKRSTPESVARLFNSTAQTNKDKLVKKGVIVMSVDPDGQDKAFVDGIKTEAHYLLGCDDVIVIKYGNQPSDRLDVSVPNHNNGSPSYSIATESGSLNW